MSVTVAKADGVTVITLTTDSQSHCPPLCQILKSLCCCSLSERLRGVQSTSQSLLGALQIMIGLLNIGLGAILVCSGSGSDWQMDSTMFPFWLGAIFVFFGSMNIVSEKCPSPCLVILNVILSLLGVGFAIASIVLYSINVANIWLWWICNDYHDDMQIPGDMAKCNEATAVIEALLTGINSVLIVLSVLELCVVISSAVLGIKVLNSREKNTDKSPDDSEHYKPLLEEVTGNCPA
ncbi:membrane-spanning 4-domains subfamily A member 6C-like [Pempheris klunzingeri]|uniref:membrane-spanning 4-domains subfamily A member 6C-like n=1 Tax=Pempheris klunzingeri TaxID=3127111 RepID=UPI00397EBABB